MSTDIPIATIEAAGPVTKDPVKNFHGQWIFPATYVLTDGQRLPTVMRNRLKRDAVAEHASYPSPPKHPTSASFDDAGVFWGTRTTISLGGRS